MYFSSDRPKVSCFMGRSGSRSGTGPKQHGTSRRTLTGPWTITMPALSSVAVHMRLSTRAVLALFANIADTNKFDSMFEWSRRQNQISIVPQVIKHKNWLGHSDNMAEWVKGPDSNLWRVRHLLGSPQVSYCCRRIFLPTLSCSYIGQRHRLDMRNRSQFPFYSVLKGSDCLGKSCGKRASNS